jgi:putative ABC transport system substrate-binding protein
MRKAGVLSILFVVILLAILVIAEAQQPAKVPRIGYVSGSGDPKAPGPLVEAFRQGLRDLGYIEGKTSWLSIATPRESSTGSQAL